MSSISKKRKFEAGKEDKDETGNEVISDKKYENDMEKGFEEHEEGKEEKEEEEDGEVSKEILDPKNLLLKYSTFYNKYCKRDAFSDNVLPSLLYLYLGYYSNKKYKPSQMYSILNNVNIKEYYQRIVAVDDSWGTALWAFMDLYNIDHVLLRKFSMNQIKDDDLPSLIDEIRQYYHSKQKSLIPDAPRTPVQTTSSYSINTPLIQTKFSNELLSESELMNGTKEFTGVNILEDKVQKIKDDPEYNRCIPVLQSSGYGKTKACIKLMKKYRCVYILCSSNTFGIDSYPQEIIDMMLTLKTTPQDERMRKAARILNCIINVASEYKTPEDLYQNQIQNNSFYVKLINRIRTQSPSGKTGYQTHFKEKLCKKSRKKIYFPKEDDLIIIFDDVANLMIDNKSPSEPSDPTNCPIRCLSRVINHSNLIGIYVSTNSTLNIVNPGHHSSNSKSSVINKFNFPVVYQIFFVNQFIYHLFVRGRPLWNSILISNKDNYQELINYAYRKLFHYKNKKISNEYLKEILLAVRFALKPTSLVVENLVANHLATMIGHENNIIIAKYHSEPILAEVSARITCPIDFNNAFPTRVAINDCIQTLKESIKPVGAMFYVDINKGDVGEIVAAMGLAYTADYIRANEIQQRYGQFGAKDLNETMSSEINVGDYLAAIIPKKDINIFIQELKKESPHLLNFTINFTHFIQEEVTDENIRIAYSQHAAFLKGGYTEGYDIVIVIKYISSDRNVEEFGLLIIQVNNYKYKISDTQRDECIDKCHPGLFGSILPSNVVTILLEVGAKVSLNTWSQFAEYPRYKTRISKTNKPVFKWLRIATGLNHFHWLPEEVINKLLELSISNPKQYPTLVEEAGKEGPFTKKILVPESKYEKDLMR